MIINVDVFEFDYALKLWVVPFDLDNDCLVLPDKIAFSFYKITAERSVH